MKNNPFAVFNFDIADLTCGVSKVTADEKSFELEWQAESDNFFVSENELGKWFMSVERSGGKTIIHSRAELVNSVEHLHFSLLECKNIPFEHILCSSMKMGGCKVFTAPESEEKNFDCFYTFSMSAGARTLLITHPLNLASWAKVSGTVKDDLVSLDICAEHHHFSGTEITFPDVTFEVGSGITLLQNYAECNTEKKRTFAPPECGWNTWDYYRWTITGDEVLKNAEFIAKDPVLSKHIKRIIIDDGWQYCYGEWYANSNFPSGMKALASEIRKLGFTPGLWVAPVCIEPHSRIAQLDYDMLGLSEGGQPTLAFDCMRRKAFVLDPTVEKSKKFLRELFDRLVKDGFEYFKLDFLAAVLDARQYHDKSVPRSQIMRVLMQSIYDGVDERAVIMGCNYPYMGGNKFVSASRVGGDIHSDWGNIKGNTLHVAYRFWMNKKLWINDPDFALCRGTETSDHPDTLQPILVFVEPQAEHHPLAEKTFSSASERELEVLLSIVMMAGGAVNLSDDLTKLNEAGLNLARKVVAAESGDAAIPLDLFSSRLPAKWQQKLAKGGRTLIVNWFDEPMEYKLDIPGIPEKALDFWKGKTIQVPQEIVLAPHSCLLLQY